MCGLSEIEYRRPKYAIFQGNAGGAAEILDPLLVTRNEVIFQGNAGGAAKILNLLLLERKKSVIFRATPEALPKFWIYLSRRHEDEICHFKRVTPEALQKL